jgi:hypothetical protein
MIYLLVDFLVLRVMIRYNNMIPLSSLSSLTDAPHQLFAYIECMIQFMISIVASLTQKRSASYNSLMPRARLCLPPICSVVASAAHCKQCNRNKKRKKRAIFQSVRYQLSIYRIGQHPCLLAGIGLERNEPCRYLRKAVRTQEPTWEL